MSAGAWVMLGITWPVVIGVSGYLFWKVIRRRGGTGGPGGPTAPGSGEG